MPRSDCDEGVRSSCKVPVSKAVTLVTASLTLGLRSAGMPPAAHRFFMLRSESPWRARPRRGIISQSAAPANNKPGLGERQRQLQEPHQLGVEGSLAVEGERLDARLKIFVWKTQRAVDRIAVRLFRHEDHPGKNYLP